MAGIERRGEITRIEVAPIKPIILGGVMQIVDMYRDALSSSKNGYELVRGRSMAGVSYKENGALTARAEMNELRAEDLAQILTMLGQEALVSIIREEVYKPK